MVILILEKVPVSLRGELSLWLIEPRTGVFVGRISAIVRDKLWSKIDRKKREGAALLIFSSQNEQGFTVRTHGDTKRVITDVDGLSLIRIPSAEVKRDENTILDSDSQSLES